MTIRKLATSVAVIALAGFPALAQDHSHHASHTNHAGHVHSSSAPLGVMGDHMHDQGQWMVSYRYMRMEMDGLRNGTDGVSPESAVTNFANLNAPPAGFRVTPTQMSTDMHMFGAMYGVTDWLTVMAMGNYIKKDMDHITFAGGAGTTRLGEFNTQSSGWGDTTVGGLVKLYEDDTHHVHANLGLSLPTGSIKEEDDVLTPMNTRPTLRLPYAMQLGSGTYDAMPGLTYTGSQDKVGWGAQYAATIRLESENNQGYQLGNRHALTAWGTYQALPWLNLNTRATVETLDEIDGSDPLIAAPVTTADPDNYGGDIASLSAGFNITPTHLKLQGHEIGFEATVPVYQDLNGPQLERDYAISAGWTYRF